MASKNIQLKIANPFRPGRPGFGELAGDSTYLHHRNTSGVGEGYRHLQDDLQLVSDGIGRELRKRFGAVAGLEQEGLTASHVGQLLGHAPGFAGENERR